MLEKTNLMRTEEDVSVFDDVTTVIQIKALSKESIASNEHSVFGAIFHVAGNHFMVFIMIYIKDFDGYGLFAYDGQSNGGYLQHINTIQGVRLSVVTC